MNDNFKIGFEKIAKIKKKEYIWLYHGTTPSNTDKIIKDGIDPKFHGSGLGAPDLLDGKKVISYTKNKDVGRIYSRGDGFFDTLTGEPKEPLLVKVPITKGFKEVTKDWAHNEIHSTAKISPNNIYLPGTAKYRKIEEKLEKAKLKK